MKKLLKLLAVLTLLSSFGFFGEEYRIVLPPLSSIAKCAESISDSVSEVVKEIHFKGSDDSQEQC